MAGGDGRGREDGREDGRGDGQGDGGGTVGWMVSLATRQTPLYMEKKNACGGIIIYLGGLPGG